MTVFWSTRAKEKWTAPKIRHRGIERRQSGLRTSSASAAGLSVDLVSAVRHWPLARVDLLLSSPNDEVPTAGLAYDLVGASLGSRV
jgi:hypothetical protein